MSTNLNTNDGLSAFERLNDDSRFDESGKIKPLDEGDTGSSATPPDQTAAGEAENTAAAQPSPDAQTAKLGTDTAKPEDKTGKTDVAAPGTEQGKAPATESEETDEALKQRFGKPEDKGDEWSIRAYREGEKLRKRLAPIQERLDRINAPDRVARGLDFVESFGNTETEISDAVAKMTSLSSSRTQELTDHIYNVTLDTYPDTVATDLVGEQCTADELKQGLALLRGGAKTGQQQTQPQSTTAAPVELQKPEGVSAEDWEDFKVDFPDLYKAMQAEHAAKQQQQASTAKTEEPTVDPKVAELTEKLKKYEDGDQQARIQATVAEIDTEGQKLYEAGFSVVKEGLRELGLEPDPAKDDERTIKLKKETAASIESVIEAEFDGPDGPNGEMDWSRCSDEQKQNRQLVKTVMDLLAKKDFNAARDYIPHIQARVDLTFQRVAAAKMELYNAAMLQPTTATRNAGQEGHKRPELVNGTAATGAGNGASKTPWLDPNFRQPGESAFEAMNRYFEGQDALPGR